MTDAATREQIERLEQEIERLAVEVERCRKIILAAKCAIAVGSLVLITLVFGLVRYDAAVLVGAMASVIGGIVGLGSNSSTLERTRERAAAAEAERAGLIGRIELRLVDENFTLRPDPRRLH